MKVLTFKKWGCDFCPDDPQFKLSNIGNWRIGIEGCRLDGNDGRSYYIEFSCGIHTTYRTTHKVTGRELKKPIREEITPCGLYLSTEYGVTNDDGFTHYYHNGKLEEKVRLMHLPYTKESVLKVVNLIAAEKFDAIEII